MSATGKALVSRMEYDARNKRSMNKTEATIRIQTTRSECRPKWNTILIKRDGVSLHFNEAIDSVETRKRRHTKEFGRGRLCNKRISTESDSVVQNSMVK